MALRGFDQLSASDLSAILGAHGVSNNGANPMASFLFAQQQQQQHQQLQHQQQQHSHSAYASFAALNGGNITGAQQFAAMNSGNGLSNSVSQLAEQQYQSQTTQLLTALLEQQQREDQKKAALIQQLNNAIHGGNSAPRQQASAPSDNLALLLHQKQIGFGSQGNGNPLSLLTGSPQLTGAPPGIFGGQSSQGGLIDASTIAKFFQSQQQPQQQQQHQQLQQQQTILPLALPQQSPLVATAASQASVSAVSATSSQNTAPARLSGSNSCASALLESAAALSLPGDRRRKGRTGTFPQKLHQMLSDLERQEGGTDIASFLPHGRAFAIHKPRDFVKHVMPKYFRMSRFSSFQRQLNLYDFQRITEGPDKGSYYHELFVQGRPILSTMMKRNKIKGVKNLKNQDGGDEGKIEEKEDKPLKEDEDVEEDEEDVE